MKKRNAGTDDTLQTLRLAALRHPNVEEALACAGTALESATFKVQGKAFLFLRSGKAMLKLDKSQDAASKLAAKKPDCYRIGSGGWTTVDLSNPKDLPMKVLENWIGESYTLFAVKKKTQRRAKKK